jgi:ribonuclease-3
LKDFDIKRIENIIGYKFRNKNLLFQAFTHSSFSNENGVPSYERLEYIGDACIGLIVALELYERYPNINEGGLTKARAQLVSRQSLSEKIDACGLIEYMQVGQGDIRINALESVRKKCDLFESILGAIMIDSNSLDEVKKIVLAFLDGDIDNIFDIGMDDAKSALLEKHKYARFLTTVEKQHFVARLLIDGKVVSFAKAKSKKQAEQAAAKAYMDKENNI